MMNVHSEPRRFRANAGSQGLWIALLPDYNDLEVGVHVHQRRISWYERALLWIPTSWRWSLTQRYQLRLSAPANVRDICPRPNMLHRFRRVFPWMFSRPMRSCHYQGMQPVRAQRCRVNYYLRVYLQICMACLCPHRRANRHPS